LPSSSVRRRSGPDSVSDVNFSSSIARPSGLERTLTTAMPATDTSSGITAGAASGCAPPPQAAMSTATPKAVDARREKLLAARVTAVTTHLDRAATLTFERGLRRAWT
jgi:hypothetical protein